jgi:outer membrane biosynthesis protein TonB
MARGTEKPQTAQPASGGSRAARLLLLGGLLVVGVLVGLLVENLYRGRPAPTGETAPAVTAARTAPRLYAPTAPLAAARADAAPEPPTIPPWESTPQNTPTVPPGHIPAWQVKSPRPEVTPPPTPVPPPDPASHRPPMHNPGGVDGDRPPRPVPGLQ